MSMMTMRVNNWSMATATVYILSYRMEYIWGRRPPVEGAYPVSMMSLSLINSFTILVVKGRLVLIWVLRSEQDKAPEKYNSLIIFPLYNKFFSRIGVSWCTGPIINEIKV